MVEAALALDPHRVEQFLDDGRARQRDAERPAGLHDETQVLEVQVDLEAGVVGARDIVRALLLEALRSGKSAAERPERARAVESLLLRERQRLAEGGQVDGD